MAYANVEDQRVASRKHYYSNKDKYLERNKKYRIEIKKYIRELKESNPCLDCSVSYPYYVMDFDHMDGKEKENNINYLSSTGRIGALKKEIVKCEIVCANCHRVRTHDRTKRSRSSAD